MFTVLELYVSYFSYPCIYFLFKINLLIYLCSIILNNCDNNLLFYYYYLPIYFYYSIYSNLMWLFFQFKWHENIFIDWLIHINVYFLCLVYLCLLVYLFIYIFISICYCSVFLWNDRPIPLLFKRGFGPQSKIMDYEDRHCLRLFILELKRHRMKLLKEIVHPKQLTNRDKPEISLVFSSLMP